MTIISNYFKHSNKVDWLVAGFLIDKTTGPWLLYEKKFNLILIQSKKERGCYINKMINESNRGGAAVISLHILLHASLTLLWEKILDCTLVSGFKLE